MLLHSDLQFHEPPEGSSMAGELLQAFRRFPQRRLLTDSTSGRHWTGAQLLDACGRIATALVRHAHLQPGQTVMLVCDRGPSELLLALAVLLAGGCLFGVSPSDTFGELHELCRVSPPDLLAASTPHRQLARHLRSHLADGTARGRPLITVGPKQLADDLNNNNNIDMNNNNNINVNNDYEELCAASKCFLERPEVHNSGPCLSELTFDQMLATELDLGLLERLVGGLIEPRRHGAFMMLTSGSTGRPKIVASSHYELVNGLYSMRQASQLEARFRPGLARSHQAALLPLGPDDSMAGDLPLDHGAGLNLMLLSLVLGARYVLMPAYDADSYWRVADEQQISFGVTSATFANRLLKRLLSHAQNPHEQPRWNLSSFHFLCTCGAKLAQPELAERACELYKSLRVCQSYGATEVGYISCLRRHEAHSHASSVGNLFPGVQAKLVDDQGRPFNQPGRAGQLCIRAQSQFSAYLTHPDDEAAVGVFERSHDADGFYLTGDLVHVDAEGRLYVHGRIKDTLIFDEDWKVLPSEIEAVVDAHPLVEHCGVVGVPDLQLPGCHAPRAFVKLRQLGPHTDSHTDTSKEPHLEPDLLERLQSGDMHYVTKHIAAFVAARVAKPKQLRGGIFVVQQIPTVGHLDKIDRNALKKMAVSIPQVEPLINS